MRAVSLLAFLLLCAVALAGCGDVGDQDEDGDGLYDKTERRGWQITVDYLRERVRHEVTSDPDLLDTDGDGLPDDEEYFLGTDPAKADSDADGLTDCQEVRHTNRSACEDTDFSGPFDGGYGTDARKADSDAGPSPYVLRAGWFTDATGTLASGRPDSGDGIPDGEEVNGYTIRLTDSRSRFVQTDGRNADSDHDGLDDGEERFLHGSDPTVQDTDGDGCRDGFDPIPARAETYGPGLRNFTLKAGGSASIHFAFLVADVRLDAPPSGGVATQPGERTDLRGLEPSPARPAGPDCTFATARHPWVFFQVQAVDTHDGRILDLHTISPGPSGVAGDGAAAWWNAQTGVLAWQAGATSVLQGGLLVFEGADGRLELAPTLS